MTQKLPLLWAKNKKTSFDYFVLFGVVAQDFIIHMHTYISASKIGIIIFKFQICVSACCATAGGATGAAPAPGAQMRCAALGSGAALPTASPLKESNAASAARRWAAVASSVATAVSCAPPTGSSAGLRARNDHP